MQLSLKALSPGLLLLLLLLILLLMIAGALLSFGDLHTLLSFPKNSRHLIIFSLTQATLSTLFSLLIGLILAWSLHYHPKFFGRNALLSLFSASLVLPSIIVAFGIIGVYGRNGILAQIFELFDWKISNLYGLKGILLAHIYLNASYATKTLLHAFETISLNRYKLSASLGFSTWQRFWHIERVALLPTLKQIAITIFLLCFSSFAIVLLLGGSPANRTLEVAIYEAIRIEFDIPKATSYALLQLLIASLLILLVNHQQIRGSDLKAGSFDLFFLQTPSSAIIQKGVIAIFTLFFLSVIFIIIQEGLNADFYAIITDPLFQQSLKTSLIVASISALFSVIFTLLLSDLKHRFSLTIGDQTSSKFNNFISLLITIVANSYLLISSLILGLGFFLLALRFRLPPDSVAPFALILTNVLLTLPFGFALVYPLLHRIGKKYDKLILSLDISNYTRWHLINLPHLKGPLIYLFTLSFCFSLGDLGIIALFGNEHFTTLPWYLYSLMGSYRNSEASGIAFLLLILILILFLIGERLATRQSSHI